MAEPREPIGGKPATSPSEPGSANVPATELRTFLIADIRGYTTYTREHGDEAGAALAARFAELVAEVVTVRGGFLLELRGDEALVVFVSARNALRAAMELQARLIADKLPRGVGIGLDAGEAIPVGDGYRGTALNLAARLCAKAGPGETLASEAVIHLAAKVEGITYVDARDLRLKGYTDKVRVLGVVPSDRTKGHRVSTSPRFSGLERNRLVLIAGGAALVIVLAAVGLVSGWFTGAAGTAKGSPSPGATEPLAGIELPVLAFYNPATGRVTATTPLPAPRNIAFATKDSFWILGATPPSLYRIDPVTHKIAQTIPIPVDEPSGFNIDEKYMWVTDLGSPRVVRIDQRTGVHSEFTFALDAHDRANTFDVAVGDGSVWLSRPDVPEIVRLNRETGRIQKRLDVYAWGLSFGAGGLWYWHDGEMGLIDPSTNTEAFDPIQLSHESILGNIHFGGGSAWTASTDTGEVYRVDRSGRQRTYNLKPGVTEMAATARTMWVTNEETGKLTGIDLVTGDQDRVIDSGHGIVAVVANEDELMIAVAPTFDDAVGGLQGNVLAVGTAGTPWWEPAPDPPTNGSLQLRQALYVTCAGLVNYPDEPGPDGLDLVPEVAAAMPEVSDDGRTYTFTIRPGFKFSPPSNEPLTAETFRSTIERALDPVLDEGAPGPAAFGDILGADQYRAGQANHVAGLKARDDRLTITLRAPAPNFLDRLASSAGCAVPIGTPALHSGINTDPPVAGAGPYYLAQIVPKRYVVLLKNPNYPGPRPQPFDAIAIRMKSASATAVAMVQKGQLDAAMLDAGDPLTGASSALATEWGPASSNAEAGRQRWFGAARPNVGYLALNAGHGAFRDVGVRRAVEVGVDRARLAAVWGDGPAVGMLSSSVRGGEDPSVIPSTPDVEGARALLKGRRLTVTMLGFPTEWGCGPCGEFERELTRQLRPIGIKVRVKHATDYAAEAFKPDSGIDLVSLAAGTDYPDPFDVLDGMHENTWLGKALLDRLDRSARSSGTSRIDEAAAFVRQVVDEDVLVVPYSHQVYPMFISDRIGCGFVQPAIAAVDLLSLCVR